MSQTNMNKNRWKFLLFVQLLIVLMMFAYAFFRPTTEIALNGFDFHTENEYVTVDDEGLFIYTLEPTFISIPSTTVSLPAGAYSVSVQYYSNTSEAPNERHAAATLSFSSERLDDIPRLDLNDYQIQADTRIYVPVGTVCDDLIIKIGYHSGELELYGITLAESMAYRFMQVLGLVLLFIAIDLFAYLFLQKNAKITERSKRLLVLGCLVAFSSLPYLTDYFPSGHDISFHLSRIASLAEELRMGQFPVYMFTEQHYGFSYPTPLYYCSLFMYLPAILYNCMLPLQMCYMIYVVSINTLTCWIAYYCFSRMTRHAMLATAIQMLNTYRLVNLYTRAAVGEYTAAAFLPLLILGMYKIYNSEKCTFKEWFPLSIGMCGIVCSHVLTIVITVFNLLIVCGILCKKTIKLHRIMAFVKAAGLCVLLCAWFWLPFVDSYLSQSVAIQTLPTTMLHEQSIYLNRLFSVFVPGYGANTFEMGLSLGGGGVLALICMLYVLMNWNFGSDDDLRKRNAIRLSVFLVVCNLLFTLNFFPWTFIQEKLGIEHGKLGHFIGTLQFPWRFLTVVSPLLAAGSAWALEHLDETRPSISRACSFLIALGLVISGSFYQYAYVQAEEPYYKAESLDYSEHGSDGLYLFNLKDAIVTFEGGCIVSDDDALFVDDYYKLNGIAYAEVDNASDEATMLTLPIFGYQNYVVQDEEDNVLEWQRGVNGRMVVEIPGLFAGTISVTYVPPAYWQIADCVSLLSMLMLIGYCLYRFAYSKRVKTVQRS